MHARPLYYSLAVLTLAASFGMAGAAGAADPCEGKRQCYPGEWQQRRDKSYYWRRYYFKSGAKDAKHKYHYVIYYPQDDWMYYYDPVSRTYWCRASKDVAGGGKLWVVLPRGKLRKGLIGEIPRTAWDRPREIPVIPGSQATGDLEDVDDMLPPPPPPKR
jgi:hypothetical protein